MWLGHSLSPLRQPPPFFALLSSIFLLSTLSPLPSCAQTAQPYLFVEAPPSSAQPNAGMLTFFRSDTTGALILLPNSASTFRDGCVPSAIDPKGRFLYSFCGDGASMYTLDPTTLAVSEVPNAPFAASQLQGFLTSTVIPESSGHFLYVSATPPCVPLTSQQLDLIGAGTFVVDPNGHGIAFLVNQQNAQSGANPNAVLYLITFDPVTGITTFDTSGGQIVGQNARALAINPTGTFLALTYGISGGTLASYTIASTSFTLSVTTDGSTPTTSSSVYSAPFSLNSAATIKAVAAAPSYTSSTVQSVAFSFRSPAGTSSLTVSAAAAPTGSTKS